MSPHHRMNLNNGLFASFVVLIPQLLIPCDAAPQSVLSEDGGEIDVQIVHATNWEWAQKDSPEGSSSSDDEFSTLGMVKPSNTFPIVSKDEDGYNGGFVEDAKFWRSYNERRLEAKTGRSSKTESTGGGGEFTNTEKKRAKNVIVLIGDGFGVQTNTMARIYKGQKLRQVAGENEEMEWESWDDVGLAKTYATDYQVSDSSSSGTAIFTGVKTKNGVMGYDSTVDYKKCGDSEVMKRAEIKSLLELAQDAGMRTGLVTTSRITHATPATLYAHTTSRYVEADTDKEVYFGKYANHENCPDDIATQFVNSKLIKNINVAFGGGVKNFILNNKTSPVVPQYGKESGKRMDKDLLTNFTRSVEGFIQVLTDGKQYLKWKNSSDHSKGVIGLFALSHLDYELDRKNGGKDRTDSPNYTPGLVELTKSALDVLTATNTGENMKMERGMTGEKNGKGFFLAIESARIDHAHHDNNAHRALDEVVLMEDTLKSILEHEKVDLEETLILVTGDHSHSVTMNGYPVRGNSIFGYVYEESEFYFAGYGDNTKHPYATISYANGNGYNQHRRFTEGQKSNESPWVDLTEQDYNSIDHHQPSLMPMDYESHGGEDVPVYVRGPMSNLFRGTYEQSYIGDAIAYASCIGRFSEEDRCLDNNVDF